MQALQGQVRYFRKRLQSLDARLKQLQASPGSAGYELALLRTTSAMAIATARLAITNFTSGPTS